MGDLRIIAGDLKGRRIRLDPKSPVRPTPDRVREALFSILGGRTSGARVLDAYAGSGALGLEALSRGARAVTFVESDAAAVAAIRRHSIDFDVADRCRLLRGSVSELIDRGGLAGPFDLVLADPPYGSPEAAELVARGPLLLAPGGLLVVEREAKGEAAPPPPGLRRERTARYGRSCLDLYGRAPA